MFYDWCNVFSRDLARRPFPPPVICAAVWSFCNAQEKIHIQNKTKQDSGMFCKELFKITAGLFEAEKMRRLAGLDNVLSVYLMTCSSLAADLDCGCYICMVCVRKHSRGTFKPSNMQSSEVTTFYDSCALHVFCYWSPESLLGLTARNRRVTLSFERVFVCASYMNGMSARHHVSPWKMRRQWNFSGIAVGGGLLLIFWFVAPQQLEKQSTLHRNAWRDVGHSACLSPILSRPFPITSAIENMWIKCFHVAFFSSPVNAKSHCSWTLEQISRIFF